jgi:ribosomal protein S18 acetylase RimI-like enzyme
VVRGPSDVVNYDIANPSDTDDVVRLLARVFSESEPPAVAMALSIADLEQFLGLVVPVIVPNALSVTARRAGGGELAGVLFTGDFATPFDFDLALVSPKFLPIFSMLDTLDEQFRQGRNISPGQYLHLFMLAVDRRSAGQGIGQGMVQTCLENGLRKGYRAAVTEATGKISQHIFRKNGFAERFSVAYRTFTYENRAVFASIQDHERAILMDRPIR